MSVASLYQKLADNGFKVYKHIELVKNPIYHRTQFGHLCSLIVSNSEIIKASALLVYEITLVPNGILVGYYNKHIFRPELGLVYSILHEGDNLFNDSILQHAIKTTKCLTNLAESNKK